ncbi:FAD-dependent oxidoreductase [Massilia mucilaginosa]|uniref:NAD(P)/FAD-dependent oxidoreductase n=1 Tax=Massilia mucilaginosa TaxID=2609282 RepID=UPI003F8A1190
MTATNQASAVPAQHGTTSAWLATASLPTYSPLMSTERADVCMIGAGIAGLTTAYMLLREGKSVVVLDALGVGAGESGRTSAHFFPPDERFFEIERSFGSDKAALVADTYRKATDCVEAIIRTERIDCEFERVDGYLFNPDGAWNDILEREYAITTRLGLNVRRFERVPGLHFDTGPCLRFSRQGQFHPLKYLDGLARAIERLGGRIHDRTRALGLRAEQGRQVVATEHGQVDAAAVVVASNTPFNERVAMHARQAGYRTYVVALRVPKDALPRVLMWDTGDPYHYVRLAPAGTGADHELLIVGGQDHKTGQDAHPRQRYDEIEAWTRRRFPIAGEVAYRWSGEVMEPSDGLAFLGRNRRDRERRRRPAARRRALAGGVPGRGWRAAGGIGGVHAPGLRGALERGREVVGLPVPRVQVRARWGGAARAGQTRAGGGHAGRHPEWRSASGSRSRTPDLKRLPREGPPWRGGDGGYVVPWWPVPLKKQATALLVYPTPIATTAHANYARAP